MKTQQTFLIFLSIVFLAFFLRFYRIAQIPAGFFFDEVTVGVNSYFLSNNLRDEFGNFLPDFIRVGEDYRHAAIFYVTALFVKILGLNVFAVRTATATFGVLIVIGTYFLVKQLTSNRKIATLSAILTAISPWLINLSRSANEVIVALLFLITADFLFIKGIEKCEKKYFVLSYLFIVLTWFSYSGAILISFLHYSFLLLFCLLGKHPKPAKILAVLAVVSFLIFPNIFYWILKPQKITGRFDQVSVLSEKGTQLTLNEQLREDGYKNSPPILVSRFFHNKLVNYSSIIVNNYSQYFSGQFLLGLTPLPLRYKIPDSGLVYFIEVPFFLLGLYSIGKRLTWQKSFIISWLLIGPIPAALTLEDSPNMQRTIFMLPAWQIITAFGIYHLLTFKSRFLAKFRLIKPVGISLLAVGFIFFLSLFMHQLFYHQPRYQNWYRSSEWESAVQIIDKVDGDYDQIEISGPLVYYHLAFYSKRYRDSIINNPYFKENRSYKSTWQVGKYSFIERNCILPDLNSVEVRTLYVNGQDCQTPGWARTLEEAKTSDGVVMLTFIDVPLTREKLDELINVKGGI